MLALGARNVPHGCTGRWQTFCRRCLLDLCQPGSCQCLDRAYVQEFRDGLHVDVLETLFSLAPVVRDHSCNGEDT